MSSILEEFCNRFYAENGKLFYKNNNKEAGWIENTGYKRVKVKNKKYLVHKILYYFYHNHWVEYPVFEIDHIDGNTLNNLKNNLKMVNKISNLNKCKVRKDSSTGYKGVVARGNNFRAMITVNGKVKWLGTFNTIEDAILARKEAEYEKENYINGRN